MYYKLICIFICTPMWTKKNSCKKWVLHRVFIVDQDTNVVPPLGLALLVKGWNIIRSRVCVHSYLLRA
jgi:hypothetical protein